MVWVYSGKVRLVDKDDSMMEHWNIFFYTMVWSSCDMVISTRFQSWTSWTRISIPVSLPCKVHVSVPTAAVYLSSADPLPTFPTCEQPSMSCGGSRKQSLQRERERSFTRIWIILVVDCFARSFGVLPTQNDKVKVWSHWILNRCPLGTRIGFSDLCCFLTQADCTSRSTRTQTRKFMKIPGTPIPNQPCTSTYQYLL